MMPPASPAVSACSSRHPTPRKMAPTDTPSRKLAPTDTPHPPDGSPFPSSGRRLAPVQLTFIDYARVWVFWRRRS
jgi:hypothetical protein